MAYNTDILFGRITKINSYDGSVTVRLEKSFIENIPEMGSVFLEIEGRPVPFFISGYDYPGAGVIRLVLDDYDTPEKVKEFIGSRVFLTSPDYNQIISPENFVIDGFKIFNQDKILIGVVKEVIHNTGQSLLNVTTAGNTEILIPLHEDLVINIDPDEKIIIMNIPEGLIEINQSF